MKNAFSSETEKQRFVCEGWPLNEYRVVLKLCLSLICSAHGAEILAGTTTKCCRAIGTKSLKRGPFPVEN